MRRLAAVVVAGLLTLASTMAQSQTYLPEPCASSPNPPSEVFYCPASYVEMVATERDLIFERAWHCRETGHSLGQVRGDTACGGWQGMFDGWVLPAAEATTTDYRAEIVARVVDPCIVGMARARPEFNAVSDEDIVALMKLSKPGAWDEMIRSTTPIVTGKNDATRTLVYKLFLAECIRAGTSGS